MFRSGGTATTAIIGTVAGGTTPTPRLASAQAVSPSAHDSAATWRQRRLNGTTAAGSRAGSVAATKRRATKNSPPIRCRVADDERRGRRFTPLNIFAGVLESDKLATARGSAT